jgi:hypothetical protein
VNQTISDDPETNATEFLIVAQRDQILELKNNYDIVRKIALVAILFLTILTGKIQNFNFKKCLNILI